MRKMSYFISLWIAAMCYESFAEEIPFDKEPHPYTITFFQIPQQKEAASIKEKKAVKESNIKTAKADSANKTPVKLAKNVPAVAKATVQGTAPGAGNKSNAIPQASNTQQLNASTNSAPNVSPNATTVDTSKSNQAPNQTANKRTVKALPKKVEKEAQKKGAVKQAINAKPLKQERKEPKINHEKRKKVAHFVSIVNPSNARDHALSFQKGAIKHPKHTMYPLCHQCAENSTYGACIKRQTLKKCDEGLNNICFTRSVKRDTVIHYEMGCADHNTCLGARAFPCRDGSVKCFTCCQWDKCNSSPHHGDYELDNINLDELDSGSSASVPIWYIVSISVTFHAIIAVFIL